MAWETRDALVRAQRMKPATAPTPEFSTLEPGSPVKSVVRLEQVAGTNLTATLLAAENETVYRPIANCPPIAAVLTRKQRWSWAIQKTWCPGLSCNLPVRSKAIAPSA